MFTSEKAVLPKECLSRDDMFFDPRANEWQLNKNTTIYLKWTSQLKKEVRESYLMTLVRFAQEYAPATTKGANDECKIYFDLTGDNDFYIDSLISHRSKLSKKDESRFSKVRMLLKKWHNWGYPGVSNEIINLLNSWTLKGFEKGKAIKRMDPTEGPFTPIEMTAVLDGLLNVFVEDKINLKDYLIAGILANTGRRPIQITSLKLCDLVKSKNKDIEEFYLNFPRAKQRFTKWRTQFDKFPIPPYLWELLIDQKEAVVKKITNIVGFRLSKKIIDQLPIFPDYESFVGVANKEEMLKGLETDFHHPTVSICNESLLNISKVSNIYSERTGKPIVLGTRRFRYTLGSNLARDGKGELVIAEALDHSDTQNVGVYVKNLPDVVERIDKAVASQLAPLAQAFQGVLIDSMENAKRKDDLSSLIGNGDVNVGNCGSYGFCNALAPIACYTCKHFQPWLDGPHEIILDQLLEKREEVLRVTEDKTISSTNDRLILAMSQVVQLCKSKKQELRLLESSNG